MLPKIESSIRISLAGPVANRRGFYLSEWTPARLKTAFHEAAHAVAAFLESRPILAASTIADEFRLGHVVLSSPNDTPEDLVKNPRWNVIQEPPTDRELRRNQRPYTDAAHAIRMAAIGSLDGSSPYRTVRRELRRLWKETELLFERPPGCWWKVTEELAHELFRLTEMTGAEVDEFIRKAAAQSDEGTALRFCGLHTFADVGHVPMHHREVLFDQTERWIPKELPEKSEAQAPAT